MVYSFTLAITISPIFIQIPLHSRAGSKSKNPLSCHTMGRLQSSGCTPYHFNVPPSSTYAIPNRMESIAPLRDNEGIGQLYGASSLRHNLPFDDHFQRL